MDTNDVLDEKDSGPEVQLNFPASVMSRIEELMGGTEQFDSDEVSFCCFNVFCKCRTFHLTSLNYL